MHIQLAQVEKIILNIINYYDYEEITITIHLVVALTYYGQR